MDIKSYKHKFKYSNKFIKKYNTVQKKNDCNLNLSEDLFCKAFNFVPFPMFITEYKNGEFIYANKAFYKEANLPKEEIIGQTSEDIGLWEKGERDNFIKLIQRDNFVHEQEYEVFKRKNKKTISLFITGMIEINNIKCLLGGFIDKTEQRILEQEVLNISELERKKIGQDLHDDVGQILLGITLLSKTIENKLDTKLKEEYEIASKISKYSNIAIEKIKNLSHDLCPVDFTTQGIIYALQELSNNIGYFSNISCKFIYDNNIILNNNTVATNLFRIAQEAINNAVKHGKPKNIELSLKKINNLIILRISDDGIGFNINEISKNGMGLKIMKYRARNINAQLKIINNSPAGVIIICTFDLII
jgi:signal transduction histidine kinase